MPQDVQAIYSNGTLTPLDLREQELVGLTISPVPHELGDKSLADQELAYQSIPPRSATQVSVQSVRRGKGTRLPYELTLDFTDDD